MKVSKKYVYHSLTAIILISFVCAFTAAAQMPAGQQQGMVSVDISNVRNDIAKDLSSGSWKMNIKPDQLPTTVQAPVSVAAQVCEMDANELSQKMQSGQATCQVKKTNQALDQIVLRQIGPKY